MPAKQLDIADALPDLPASIRKIFDKSLGWDTCDKCGEPTLVFRRGPLNGFVRFGCWHTQARMTVLLIRSVLKKEPVKKKRKRL